MYNKSLIWVGVFVGTTVGGIVPALWGASLLGYQSILGTLIGGILGIWGAIKLSRYL